MPYISYLFLMFIGGAPTEGPDFARGYDKACMYYVTEYQRKSAILSLQKQSSYFLKWMFYKLM